MGSLYEIAEGVIKVQVKYFFIAEFQRAAKIRKTAVYSFFISYPVTEL